MIAGIVIVSGIILALVLPMAIYPILARLGVVDVPNSRSSHVIPTIRGMGVALAISGCLTTAVLAATNGDSRGYFLGITALGLAAACLGFMEDLRGIRVAKRAFIQLAIGTGFGYLVTWMSEASWILIPISAIAIAAYINVANFMDGINGISGLHGGVAGISYSVLGMATDRMWMTQLGLVVAGVFLAFLPWNLSRRRVFLGDVGSYFLGAWIAGIAVLALATGLNPLLVAGPTVIYLADTGFTLLRRVFRGERWFEAHRSHVYQQLTSRSSGHVHVALLVAGFSLLTALVSFLTLFQTWISTVVSLVLMVFISFVYLSLPGIIKGSRTVLLGGSK